MKNTQSNQHVVFDECFICGQMRPSLPPRAAPFRFICRECYARYKKQIFEALSLQDMEVID